MNRLDPLRLRRIRLFAAVSVILSVLVLVSVPARGRAETLPAGVTLDPSAQRISTVGADGGGGKPRPGSIVQRDVHLSNGTDAPITFSLAVLDVVGADASTVVDIVPPTRESAAANWTSLGRSSVVVPAGKQVTIVATVRIPDDVAPGSYAFAVTATYRGATSPGTMVIEPSFRQVGIFILELPGGPGPEWSIRAAKLRTSHHGGTYDVTAEVHNSGHRLITPAGSITVRDLFGRVVRRVEVPRVTAYPDGSNAVSGRLRGIPRFGVFRTTVELHSSPGGDRATRVDTDVRLPGWVYAALFVVAVFGALGWNVIRIRRRSVAQLLHEYPESEDELW